MNDTFFALRLQAELASCGLSEKIALILKLFDKSYAAALAKGNSSMQQQAHVLNSFLDCVKQQLRQPHVFEPYHTHLRQPFDYYQFGLDFFRPLVDFSHSRVLNPQRWAEVAAQLQQGDNVILLANHQTEVDPQLISLMLETTQPDLAREMVFIAGDRVVSDPLAVPFSLGRNLLCIHSKKHIDHPPERRTEKLMHNQRALSILADLMQSGGKCIYVAPSGGRDRKDESGTVALSPFDPQSIDMMELMAKRSKRPCHFYPFMLRTHDILPPPPYVESDLGEWRSVDHAPIFIGLAESFAIAETRETRAQNLWQAVDQLYKLSFQIN